MLYHYLRAFKWLCTIFGLHYPFPASSGRIHTYSRFLNLWSLVVIMSFIATYFYPNNVWSDIKVKTHLDEISSANNLIVNVIIIFLNVCNTNEIFIQIYRTFYNILHALQIHNKNQKLFAIKLYTWMFLPFIVFITLIALEFVYASPPYTLIVKMPIILSILHLVIHLTLMLAILKVLNWRIFENFKIFNNYLMQETRKNKSIYLYFFSPVIRFFDVESQQKRVDLKLFCRIYDDIGISLNLLQRNHGIQMLLSVWLMFSNAVTGITLITKEWANITWVVFIRSTLPFLWYFMGCYVDNQLRQEVTRTESLIMKYLIDFRCDEPTKEILQTFKQVVATNRLEFTACNVFRLNYASILNTVVNVITYSIILIQIL